MRLLNNLLASLVFVLMLVAIFLAVVGLIDYALGIALAGCIVFTPSLID